MSILINATTRSVLHTMAILLERMVQRFGADILDKFVLLQWLFSFAKDK